MIERKCQFTSKNGEAISPRTVRLLFSSKKNRTSRKTASETDLLNFTDLFILKLILGIIITILVLEYSYNLFEIKLDFWWISDVLEFRLKPDTNLYSDPEFFEKSEPDLDQTKKTEFGSATLPLLT